MTWWSLTGALLGALTGVGILLAGAGLPARRRLGLAGRVLPYLADAPRPSRLLLASTSDKGVLGTIAGPSLVRLGGMVERLMGGAVSVRRRLQRAGLADDLDAFRAQQFLWGAAGAIVGLGFDAVLMAYGRRSVVPLVLLPPILTVTGLSLKDYRLSRLAERREARMLLEFPTIAELLAMAVSAGEGAVGALDRVCRLSQGALSSELRHCLADARAGANLPLALQGLADRTGLPSLARFVDGIIVAVERGTPLADVLRAQAQDVREESRRAVMETAGKKEIAMMMPVVFLILPVTILFAIFPGWAMFQFTM